MTISYMPIENCPKCGQILDYFNTFSTHGKKCRSCKWEEEIDDFTGEEYRPLPCGEYTITVNGCVSYATTALKDDITGRLTASDHIRKTRTLAENHASM